MLGKAYSENLLHNETTCLQVLDNSVTITMPAAPGEDEDEDEVSPPPQSAPGNTSHNMHLKATMHIFAAKALTPNVWCSLYT